jgi:hypothetical protein
MSFRASRLPAYMDARSSEELAIALVREDEKIIQEWRRRVAENEARRRDARVMAKIYGERRQTTSGAVAARRATA